MERIDRYDACAVGSPSQELLDLIASKWTVLILDIINCGKVRYSHLQRAVPSISQKVLTGVLRRLEENGIITRTVYPVVPPHVEYEITELGKTLVVSLQALREWSETHVPHTVEAQKAYRQKTARLRDSAPSRR